MRGSVGTAILAMALVAPGCFSYQARSPESIPQGEEVRVVLHPAATERMAERFGWNRSRLTGLLTRVTDDSISVSVRVSSQTPGTAFSQARQVVTVGKTEVVQVEQPQLNRNRTAFLVAGGAVAGGFLLSRMFQADRGTGPEQIPLPGGPTDPSIISIRIFR